MAAAYRGTASSSSPGGLQEPLLEDSTLEDFEENVVTTSYHPGDSVRPLTSIHCREEHYRTALLSAASTLGLGCLGSSVLPMPYAFSKTGIVIGIGLMLIVAYANDFTAKMLLTAAAATRTDTYEACAEAVGGRLWKIWAQLTLLALLFGTTCGAVSLFRDVGTLIVSHIEPTPRFLGVEGGLAIQLLLVVGLVLPLCLLKDIRSLDRCGPFAIIVVVALIIAVIASAANSGFPALRSGDLPLLYPQDVTRLPEAVALLGFAFYLHPCLIPVLREMPAGRIGLRATISATRIVLYGACILVYGSVGIFGAARFGTETMGDILENDFVSGTVGVVLVSSVAAYLAVSLPPIVHVLRTSLSQMVTPEAEFSWVRHSLETVGLLAAALLVDLVFDHGAEKIFAVTGSTGVCMACYVMPICIYRKQRHLEYRRYAEWLAAHGGTDPHRLPPGYGIQGVAASGGRKPPPGVLSIHENLMSMLVLIVGVVTSALALWTALFQE